MSVPYLHYTCIYYKNIFHFHKNTQNPTLHFGSRLLSSSGHCVLFREFLLQWKKFLVVHKNSALSPVISHTTSVNFVSPWLEHTYMLLLTSHTGLKFPNDWNVAKFPLCFSLFFQLQLLLCPTYWLSHMPLSPLPLNRNEYILYRLLKCYIYSTGVQTRRQL